VKFYNPDEYQAIASHIFLDLEKKLYSELPYAVIKFNGSSMLPNAISKGDLDIYIQVPADKFEESIAALNSQRFIKKDDSGETNDFCLLHSTNFQIPVDIQLVCNGSDYENLMYFVERMKDRPDLIEKYNQLKLATQHLSEIEYSNAKTKFIYDVIEGRVK